MIKHIFKFFNLFLFSFILFSSCESSYTPKPRGFFRIDFPEKEYQITEFEGCPFSLHAPVYTQLIADQDPNALPCWFDMQFPDFNAKVHFTYMEIDEKNKLREMTDDAYEFAFKHTVKATGIDQIQISNPDKDVYGLIYDIKGNTASNFQFYLTDSSRHYLRAALYFEEVPNLDSIRPVLDFIKEDLYFAIHNFNWDHSNKR